MNTCDDRSYIVKYQLLERAVATDVNPYVYDNELGEPIHSAYGGRRSPAVACWASDHWVASSNPLGWKFRH